MEVEHAQAEDVANEAYGLLNLESPFRYEALNVGTHEEKLRLCV